MVTPNKKYSTFFQLLHMTDLIQCSPRYDLEINLLPLEEL